MKKVLLVGLVSLLALTAVGCGNNNGKIDLTKAVEEIDGLKSGEFSRAGAVTSLMDPTLFGEVEDIYTLSDVGISEENVTNEEGMYDYSMAREVGKENGYSYFIGKPADGKKDALVAELDAYYEGMEDQLLKEEIEGYLVYIVSSDNDKALSLIKEEGYPSLFGMMGEVTDEVLSTTFNINTEDVEEYAGKTSMMIVSASSYMIMKPAEGKKEAVKEAMADYMAKQEEQWGAYLPAQYDLVKNRLETEVEGYLVYVVSEDNDAVLKAIKNNIVK